MSCTRQFLSTTELRGSAQPTMAIETAQRHDVAGYSVRIVTPAPNTAVCCRVYAGAVGSAPA